MKQRKNIGAELIEEHIVNLDRHSLLEQEDLLSFSKKTFSEKDRYMHYFVFVTLYGHV